MTSARNLTPSSRCSQIHTLCFLALTTLLGTARLVETADIGPLWLAAGVGPAPSASAKLEEVLSRVGPNMRSSADYRDFRDVQLNESLEAWRILHGQVSEYAGRQALILKPPMLQLLKEASISSTCLNSADELLEAARHLESWAIQMWSFSGSFPPVAQFAGNYHDMGSYKGCIDLVRPSRGPPNETHVRFASTYCTIGFRPVVPARPRFHLIYKQVERELVNQYEADDIVGLVASRAQYFHYLYLKTGVCVPSECTARDIQLVTKTIGRRLALMPAPVKCFTRSMRPSNDSQLAGSSEELESDGLDDLENNRPVQIDLNRKLNTAQVVALLIIGGFFSIVLVATLWHGFDLVFAELRSKPTFASSLDLSGQEPEEGPQAEVEPSGFAERASNGKHQSAPFAQADNKTSFSIQTKDLMRSGSDDGSRDLKASMLYYFSIITNGTEFCDTTLRSNEIKCLHGFRVFTMLWIICVHVLQYCDWSGFTRIFENVQNLRNPVMHPVINANYVVDNFFLMSGLLASYTTWHSNKGTSVNFSFFRSLLARYLRLTPQVLLISLMYILLPKINPDSGPFWYDMTHYAAKYCEKNWWVNLLHLQSFYRSDEMCNLVGWWISVDMFYYMIGLVVLWMILNKWSSTAYWVSCGFVAFSITMTAWRHYSWGLEPNNLALVPQVGEVWSEFVIKFFWSPYPHAYVFFLGIWLGYLMANKIGIQQVRRWSKLGWFLSLTSMAVVSMSSRLWLTDVLELSTDHQLLSTSYNIICVIAWGNSFGWMIVACHYGCAPMLDQLLSIKATVILSKASFIIYLSHMLILRTFFGSQYNLFEVSMSIVLFQIIGITFLSIIFGVFLCVAFEAPCMKLQRLVMDKVHPKRKLPPAGISYASSSSNRQTSASNQEKITLNSANMLFK